MGKAYGELDRAQLTRKVEALVNASRGRVGSTNRG
jgi:hypothetical protein